MGDIMLILRRTSDGNFYVMPMLSSNDEVAIYGPEYPQDYIRRRQIPKVFEDKDLIYEDRFTVKDPRWQDYAYKTATVAMDIDTMTFRVLKWSFEPPNQ